MPLVRGRYHATNPIWSALGQPVNATQSDIAVRSNADYLGTNCVDQTAALVSGSSTFVPVAVEVGDTITKVTVEVGNTAASTPTHFQVGVYSGVLTTAALLSTTTDKTTTAVSANTEVSFSLSTTITATAANAPNGYWYVALGFTGTTPPSLLGPTASAHDFSFTTLMPNKPLVCGTQAVGAGGTMPSTVTLASNSSQAAVPLVFLS